MDKHSGREAWHFDKRIPLALIITIFLQTATAVWFVAKLESRVSVLEREDVRISARLEDAQTSVHDVEMLAAGFEEKFNAILRAIERIERRISRDRGR